MFGVCRVSFLHSKLLPNNRSSRCVGRELLGRWASPSCARSFGLRRFPASLRLLLLQTAKESPDQEINDMRGQKQRSYVVRVGRPLFLTRAFVKHFITSKSEAMSRAAVFTRCRHTPLYGLLNDLIFCIFTPTPKKEKPGKKNKKKTIKQFPKAPPSVFTR